MLVYASIMPSEAYFRDQATRYFRIARAKSDPDMAARFEAMARDFLAKAEAAASTRDLVEVNHAMAAPTRTETGHQART